MSVQKSTSEKALELEVRAETGKSVRARRLALGLTVEQLAERTGMLASTVERVELGYAVANVTVLLQLAIGLQCQVGDIVPSTERFQNMQARKRAD